MAEGKLSRHIQTLAGHFELTRPYIYCRACRLGYFPLDAALGLSDSSKQYDVQDVKPWLSSETAYETDSETYERITGVKLSEHHMHEATNAIGQKVGIFDTCPSKDDIHKKIEELSENKFRRPIMMLALDGAHGPMRPEPSSHPRKGKRGEGEWKEIKGFRLYLIDGQSIVHVISWHQAAAEREQVDLRTYRVIYEAVEDVRNALEGLLKPEEKETILGEAEVLELFKISRVGTIAGCTVRHGIIPRTAKVRLVRDGSTVYTGGLSSLKRFKDDVKEVREGLECGIGIENFNDLKVGDRIEAFRVEEVKCTLESSASAGSA